MRRLWIAPVLIGFLALLGFWLASNDETDPAPEPKRVEAETRFPRPDAKSAARAEKRRTHVMRFQEEEDDDERERPKRDPLMVAFRSDAQTALIMETRELLDTPAGQLLTNCLVRDQAEAFNEMVEATGLDPLEDVERWGMFGDGESDNSDMVVVAEGDFAEMKFGDAVDQGHLLPADSYGDSAEIYALPSPPDAEGADVQPSRAAESADPAEQMVYARWSESMVLFGTREEVEASIDRLEGRASSGSPAIPEHEAYGEAYGFIAASKLAALMPPEFREGLASADRAKVHMDAPDDVFLTTDIIGSGPELSRSVTGMAETIAALRDAAEAEGNEEALDLLDLARIAPTEEGFTMETGMPLEMLEKQMAENCKPRERSDEPAQ